MQTPKPRLAAAALALVAVTSILGGIDALTRSRFSSTVVSLPTVEIVAVRVAAAAPERVVR